MVNNKHSWTYEENKFCCQMYVEYYINNKRNININSFVEMINKNLPQIKYNSLKMDIQNIKQILLELNIKDTLECTPLKNYSKQNFKAMKEVIESNNIEK